jgi:Zn-finger nucleic acid-binding protein
MFCPKCNNGLIFKKTKRGDIHQCEQCWGMWFDEANFGRYSVWLACEMELKKEIDLNFRQREVTKVYDIKEAFHLCPQCQTAMAKVNYFYDSNIIIDKCKSCKGIWTDSGEIGLIAKHIKRDPRVEAIYDEYFRNKVLEEIISIEATVNMILMAIGKSI